MRRLCAIDDISEPGSKGFDQSSKGSVFVVRYDGQIFVYANKCPHLGVNLEWEPDRFLDQEERLIQCSMHGALFQIKNGECLSGPCAGDSLTTVAHEIKDSAIYLPD